ncbi:hypothetical protein [uncultured Tateyamaria sp.]|uniref:hypothetical protein n=1 Tax=Tateyamaria sp. 1078 TaxID=3417464 RepID=UPI00262B2C0B|nr:hypothetical protein [uncultured Tateyamaria sp.]
MPRAAVISLSALLLVATSHMGAALTPLPPCHGVEEGEMRVGDTLKFARTSKSIVTLENYMDPFEPQADGVYGHRNATIKALHDFNGVRLVDCATGRFLAINDQPELAVVSAALAATEFLRADVQADQPVTFNDVRRAAHALYSGDVLELRETEVTCGCQWYGEGDA